VECGCCRSVSARLPADQSARAGIYERYYDQASFEIPDATAASLDRLIASFAPFRHTGRLIDVGYGEGGLLSAAQRQGWSCYGTEADPRALEYGRRHGWMVAAASDRDEPLPEQGFDVVTMLEFLEHMPEPERFLRAALGWLRPGGILYLTTPNAQSLNRRLLGLDWSVICPPDHVTIWTARGVRAALANAGFRCLRIRTEGLNPGEIVARLNQKQDVPVPINRQQVAVNLNSAFSRSPIRRAVKNGLNQVLSAFGAGDSIKVWATPEAS
jgi:SAM-dependent methyltransferase